MAAKPLVPKLAEFQAIKAWINELYEYSGDAIRQKKTVTAHTCVLTRMKWLIDEAKRLTAPFGGIDKDMVKVARFIDQAVIDQEKAIKGGQFVRVNASLFRTARWLVRELEKVVLTIVDEDEARLLTAAKMVPEGGARVDLDVTDILGDGEDDDEEAAALAQAETV